MSVMSVMSICVCNWGVVSICVCNWGSCLYVSVIGGSCLYVSVIRDFQFYPKNWNSNFIQKTGIPILSKKLEVSFRNWGSCLMHLASPRITSHHLASPRITTRDRLKLQNSNLLRSPNGDSPVAIFAS